MITNKHIYFASVLLLMVLSSCKKIHICECTTTINFPGQSPHLSKSSESVGQTTEAQAQAICKASEEQLNEHLKQQLSDPKVNSTSSAACAIK